DLAVLVRDAVPELAVLVAVGLTHIGEVVDVARRDLREIERVLARVEAERDDDVVLAEALPDLHRALVPAEADVSVAVHVRRIDGVRTIDAPHGRRLEHGREDRRERPRLGPVRGLAATVDDDALAGRDARELREELGDVAR